MSVDDLPVFCSVRGTFNPDSLDVAGSAVVFSSTDQVNVCCSLDSEIKIIARSGQSNPVDACDLIVADCGNVSPRSVFVVLKRTLLVTYDTEVGRILGFFDGVCESGRNAPHPGNECGD